MSSGNSKSTLEQSGNYNFELIAKMFKMMCTRNGDTRNKQYYISVSDRWYTVKFQTEWINYIKSAEWELMKGG